MLCICIMQFGHGWEDSFSTVGKTFPQHSTSCLKRPEMDFFQHVGNILTPLSSWTRTQYRNIRAEYCRFEAQSAFLRHPTADQVDIAPGYIRNKLPLCKCLLPLSTARMFKREISTTATHEAVTATNAGARQEKH